MNSTTRVLVLASLLASLISFRQNAFAADVNSEMDSAPIPVTDEARHQILEWNLKTLVQAYEEAGHTNAVWDQPAKTALNAYACLRARMDSTNGPWKKIVFRNAVQACQAGCNDPLVNYLRLRNAPMDAYGDSFRFFIAAATNLNSSSYRGVRAFYAYARAIHHLDDFDQHRSPAVAAIRNQLLPRLKENLELALHDTNMPAREAYEISNMALSLMEIERANYQDVYGWIHPFFDNWGDDYTTLLLKGKAYVQLAWFARGDREADNVTEEGWKKFFADLEVASEALEKAWLTHTNDVEIPDTMLSVVLGQQGKLADLDLWFDRSMMLNTNNYRACRRRLNYLEPKWYGSDKKQLEFGRWCATSLNWGGRVPLILVDAHEAVNGRNEEPAHGDYWKRPEVWEDVQRSYNRFFELNPDDVDEYENYAWHAYRAEQWDKLNELLPKIKQPHYSIWGNMDEYFIMVRIAKEHAASKQ
jgi:hypothetical protein